MRDWAFPGFIASMVLAHLVLHLALGIGTAAPDLLTVAVLLSARRTSGASAALLGFVLGLLDGAGSLGGFGAAAVALTLLGYLGARSRELFEGESTVFAAVYLFLGKWLRDAIVAVLAPATVRGGLVATLAVEAPIAAAYAAVIGAVALTFFRAIER